MDKSSDELLAENERLRSENDLLIKHIKALHQVAKLGPVLSEAMLKEVLDHG